MKKGEARVVALMMLREAVDAATDCSRDHNAIDHVAGRPEQDQHDVIAAFGAERERCLKWLLEEITKAEKLSKRECGQGHLHRQADAAAACDAREAAYRGTNPLSPDYVPLEQRTVPVGKVKP